MEREHNVLNTSLSQALSAIGEARNRYKNAKVIHANAHQNTNQQCQRLARMQEIATKCQASMKQCKMRQNGIAHLIAKRNRLRAELEALNSSAGRMGELKRVLDDEEDFSWEGVYEGRGRYAGFRVRANDEDSLFRVTSNRVGAAEESLGVSGSHALSEIGKAFRFCLDAGNSETCGEAVLDDSGFSMNGVPFKKVA